MKFINASIIIFTSLVITSDIFADAAQQLRCHRGLVENEDVLVSFVNDTITGEIISNVEDIAHPTPPMISASERANDQVSDYGGECRASEGCTCAAKHVYKSTRECVLVQSTSTVKNSGHFFRKVSCDRSYKLTAYDCNRCQNFVQHTDSGMVGNGSNRDITNSLRLNNGFRVSGLFPGASRTSKRDWCIKINDFYTEGNSIFAFDRDTSCTGRGGDGSVTSNNLYQFQKCKGNDRSEINA